MKKSLFKKGAIGLAAAIAISSFIALPSITAKAATTFTIDQVGTDGNPFKVTFVTTDTVEYQLIDDSYCGFNDVIIDGEDLAGEGQWDEAKSHLQSGYDDLYFYQPSLELYNCDYPTGKCNGTLTLPIPAGHTKVDAYDARIICNFDMNEFYYDVIKPSAVTDTTVSFDIFLGASNTYGNIRITSELFVEYKNHEHTWDAGIETTAATHTADGTKTYTCTVCGEKKTETIPKLVANNEDFKDEATGNEYIVNAAADGSLTASITGSSDTKAKKINIPEKITLADGTTAVVTEIAANAFKNSKAKEITIPKTVVKIGTNAFSGSSAKKITIKTDKKGNISIGKGAFKKLKAKNVKILIKGCKGKAKTKLVKKIKKQTSSGTTVK